MKLASSPAYAVAKSLPVRAPALDHLAPSGADGQGNMTTPVAVDSRLPESGNFLVRHANSISNGADGASLVLDHFGKHFPSQVDPLAKGSAIFALSSNSLALAVAWNKNPSFTDLETLGAGLSCLGSGLGLVVQFAPALPYVGDAAFAARIAGLGCKTYAAIREENRLQEVDPGETQQP